MTIDYCPISSSESLLTGIRRFNNSCKRLREQKWGATIRELRYARQQINGDWDHYSIAAATNGSEWDDIGMYTPGATTTSFVGDVLATYTRYATYTEINATMEELRSSFASPGTTPSLPYKGQRWWNSSDTSLNVFNGTTWGTVPLVDDGIRNTVFLDRFPGGSGINTSKWNITDSGTNVISTGGVVRITGDGSWNTNGLTTVLPISRVTGDRVYVRIRPVHLVQEAQFAISTYSSLQVDTGLQIRVVASDQFIVLEDAIIANTFSTVFNAYESVDFKIFLKAAGYTITMVNKNQAITETYDTSSTAVDYANAYLSVMAKTNAKICDFDYIKYSALGYVPGSATYQDYQLLTSNTTFADSRDILNNSMDALRYTFAGSTIPDFTTGLVWFDDSNEELYVFNGTTVSNIELWPRYSATP